MRAGLGRGKTFDTAIISIMSCLDPRLLKEVGDLNLS